MFGNIDWIVFIAFFISIITFFIIKHISIYITLLIMINLNFITILSLSQTIINYYIILHYDIWEIRLIKIFF